MILELVACWAVMSVPAALFTGGLFALSHVTVVRPPYDWQREEDDD